MKKPHPCDPYSRFLDLQKQGFMKPLKVKKAKKAKPTRIILIINYRGRIAAIQ